MKKSLACTILAGLLMGGVMMGAEAAIDIVISADGTVTPNTYTSMTYTGVSAESGTTDFGSDIASIKTNGKLNTKSYTSVPVGTPVFGIGVGPSGFVQGSSVSVININVDSLGCGIYNNNMSNNGSVNLTNLGKIVVNGDSGAYGIHMGHGTNVIGFTGDSSIEVTSENGDMYGICISGGSTTVTGLKNITVSNSEQHNSYAIYSSGGEIDIGGENNENILYVDGIVENMGGTIRIKNAFITGNFHGGFVGYDDTESVVEGMFLDGKIVVNGDTNIIHDICADDASDDFSFGKIDNTSHTFFENLVVSDVGAKVKIYGSDFLIQGIKNKGTLVVNPDIVPGCYSIGSDVYHYTGANTEINLVGKKDGYTEGDYIADARGLLYGNIYGSDENFKMTLDMSDWILHNEEDGVPVVFDPVYNVSLKRGANVLLNPNTQVYVSLEDQSYQVNWKDRYSEVTFRNLKNDGTGVINLAVDLANSVGDQIILQGEIPEKLGVALVNKDNNGGEAFVPDGEHKVTYAKAPIGSSLKIDTTLVPVYGKQSMIYTPIVEETTTDMREWNFVGWSQRPRGDSKLNAKDELDVPNLLPEMEEKRLEEIHRYAVHNDLSELGAWVRGETGKMSADGVDFDVKVISGGYDWANKTSKGNFFMGVGVSHGTSNADMSFVGDSKNTSFSVYGSWYGRKNYDYIDFVAKYGKIDHQYGGTNFEGVLCEGEYDKKMYSFFTKYGRRLPLKNGYYVEPFGSLTYGHINDADFHDKGQDARMHVNAILSKIVSVGAMFGRNVKGTELYCKLAYSYDFDGVVRGSVPDQNYNEKTDLGGSSYKFAIGASRNLGKQNSLHFDVEKDFGGKMKRPWNVALTFKHTW